MRRKTKTQADCRCISSTGKREVKETGSSRFNCPKRPREAARGHYLSRPHRHLSNTQLKSTFFFGSPVQNQQLFILQIQLIMPAKELNQPCMECKDAESELTVRQKQLCRYVTIYNLRTPPSRPNQFLTATALSASLHTKSICTSTRSTNFEKKTMVPATSCSSQCLSASPRRSCCTC